MRICHWDRLEEFQGQIRGFQIIQNIPVVQRNKQKDFGVSGMFNYEVIQVYI
jgi:hypothetical protein